MSVTCVSSLNTVCVYEQVVLYTARDFKHFLCLGGRSHAAYCNRVVCHSVSLSVTPFLLHTLNGDL